MPGGRLTFRSNFLWIIYWIIMVFEISLWDLAGWTGEKGELGWNTTEELKKNSRSAFPASSRQGMFVMIIKWSSMSVESNHILVHYFLFPKEYVFSFVKFTNRYNLELTHLLFHLQQNSKTKYTASKRQCIFGSVQLCEIFFICMTKKSRNKNEQGSFNCFTRDLHSAL